VVPDKKGKTAKKVEEEPVDIYQGLDTTIFKELGHSIKQILGEGADLNSLDLVGAVNDDLVLVRLLAAKLKLTFLE